MCVTFFIGRHWHSVPSSGKNPILSKMSVSLFRHGRAEMWCQMSSRGQWSLVQVSEKRGHCILILWCIFMGFGHIDPRVESTDLNTWIAGSHGFAYSSMRATGNPSAAILLQSKHWIDAVTYAHVSAWMQQVTGF